MVRFSIIIPVFNRAAVISETLNAVLAQTWPNFEVLVVDDGSSDGLKESIASYLEDPRFHFITQPNAGVSAARNTGAAMATGEYLVFLDSDDLVQPDWLKDYQECIMATNADLAFCAIKKILPTGEVREISPTDPYGNGIEVGNYIPGSFCVSRDLFNLAGSYDQQIRYSENTELGLRLRALSPSMGFIDKANLIYLASVDGGRTNWKNRLEATLTIMRKHQRIFNSNRKLKQVYLGAAGVSAIHCSQFRLARKLFFRAYCADLTDMKVFLRFVFAWSPILSRKVWSVGTDEQ